MITLQSICKTWLSKANKQVVECNGNESFQYKCRTKKAPAEVQGRKL